MRTSAAVSVVLASFFVVAACGHSTDQSGATSPTATATYGAYPGYPTAPGQPPPPGYPTAGAPTGGYPPPGYAPTATAPQPYPPAPTAAPAGTMAVPGPLALPCQSDASCGLHHCNTQYGKCAFPCASAADCVAPNNCFVGVCLPAPPAGH